MDREREREGEMHFWIFEVFADTEGRFDECGSFRNSSESWMEKKIEG